jgi:septal ring factor EnvC (AmiA/AmiB activator)
MYKLGQGRYARLWLSTADLRRLGEAARTVAALAQLDHDRVAAHQRTLDDLRSTRAALQERSTRLDALRVEARRAQADAERATAARTNAIRNIDRQRDLNAQLAGELQGAQQKLQGTLRSLAGGPAASEPSALPLKAFQGDLGWPVSGSISRRFTRPEAGQAGVNGIEIAAAEGSAVVAVHEGVVAYADAFTGFGNLVIVDHGSQTFSLYGNLAGIEVKKGARIQAGQTVGSVGLSPAGPAGLYFELRVDGQAVDPLQWLKKR